MLLFFFEDVPVVCFKCVNLTLQKPLPIKRGRDGRLLVVGRLRLFVGHLEKGQERDLFRLAHVQEAIVPRNVGEFPGFFDDLLRVVAHPLPQPLDAVSVKLTINADDRNILCQSLRDEEPVERVFVVELHRGEQGHMPGFDGQNVEIIGRNLCFHELLVRLWQSVLAELDLDGDLPIARRADFDLVRRVFNKISGRRTQLRIIEDEPEKRMCIEQQPHSMYSAKSFR
jgi:hypothetical protein